MMMLKRPDQAAIRPAKFVSRAQFVGWVGLRGPDADGRLKQAFSKGCDQVRSFRINGDRDDTRWFAGGGWWLSMAAADSGRQSPPSERNVPARRFRSCLSPSGRHPLMTLGAVWLRRCVVSAAPGRRPRLNNIKHAHLTNRDAASMNFHRQALQPQFANRTAINRHKARVDEMRLRKPRQQAADRNGDGGATENVADAVMRARTKR